MSRPYQNSFDSIQSPLNRQQPDNYTSSTSASASGQPPSFKTNVNRAKTKRWVEAKSVSYDGDDWGDDEDEYGGYDEPPPPPKPTGYRQKGQVPGSSPVQMSASPGGFGTPSAPQPGTVFDDHRRRYGDLPGQAPASSQPKYQSRGISNPQPVAGRERSNSFDEGDERRAFSAGGSQPWPGPTFTQQEDYTESPTAHAGPAPPTRFSQMGIGMPSPDPETSKNLPPIPPMPESVQPSPHSSTHANQGPPPLQVQTQPSATPDQRPTEGTTSPGSNSSIYSPNQRQPSSTSTTNSIGSYVSDFQARRDFSPTALPSPLQTQVSPASRANEVPSPGGFPPRKSSLSQKNPSYPASNLQGSPGGFVTQVPQSTPTRKGSGSPMGRTRAGSNSGKPLPFVRPADIYKRMDEERERERQSSESRRPSMDSIIRRTSERDITSSSDDFEKNTNAESMRPCREDSEDADSSRRLKPMLDPVEERTSEYGLDGLVTNARSDPIGTTADHRVEQHNEPATPDTTSTELDQSTGGNGSHVGHSRTPSLPQVSRVSGFGDDFWSSDQHDAALSLTAAQINPPIASSQVDNGHLPYSADHSTLNRNESQGFSSIVRQAFDRQDDRSVPPTPSSISGSQRSNDGLGVSRTDSHSTAGISPIMSRVPSAAAALEKAKGAEVREAATPAIAEEPTSPDFNPDAESTLSTPRNQSRRPTPSHTANPSTDTIPNVFMAGHRRNPSTPSPRGSPARSPAVKTSHEIAEGTPAELGNTTPTETRPMVQNFDSMPPLPSHAQDGVQSLDYNTREVDVASAAQSTPSDRNLQTASSVNEAQSLFLDTRVTQSSQSRSSTPIGRTESPSKGKVRDLAGRFENNQSPVSATPTRGLAQSSPSRTALPSSVPSQSQDLMAPRPTADRVQSFRPSLPGGWVSYATTAGSSTPAPEESATKHIVEDPNQSNISPEKDLPGTPVTMPNTAKEDLDITPTTARRTLSESERQPEDLSRGAFAAVAAAGAAMAEAFTAAVGMDSEPSNTASTPVTNLTNRDSPAALAEGRLSDHIPDVQDIHQQSHDSPSPDNAASGTDPASPNKPPTPPPKDTPAPPAEEPVSGYFPPTVPLNYRNIGARSDVTMPPLSTRPQMLPTLSTDTSPNDQESDRLRKEIVRTLSPQSATLDRADGPNFPDELQKTSSVPTGTSDSRESTLFPSEYENYWASLGEDDSAGQQRQLSQVQEYPVESGRQQPRAPDSYSDVPGTLQDHLLPAHSRNTEGSSERARPPQGFPYEDTSEVHRSATHTPSAGDGQQSGHTTENFQGHSRGFSDMSHDAELSQLLGTRNAYFDQAQGREIRKEHNTGPLHVLNPDEGSEEAAKPIEQRNFGPASRQSIDGLHPVEREPASVTEQYNNPAGQSFEQGLELAGETGMNRQDQSNLSHNPWTESEDINQNVYRGQNSTNEISQRSPWASDSTEQAHVYGDKKSVVPISAEDQSSGLTAIPPSPLDGTGERRRSTQPGGPEKIPAFREILARKSPADRIHAYNSARIQVANTDTGLARWVAITASQNPLLLPSSTRPVIGTTNPTSSKRSPTQATFGKRSPTNQQQAPSPYPHHLTAGTGSSPPGRSTAATATPGTSPGLAGSGTGKLSSREVQAKGKDFLHSAGIFGGKANVAAKGLFAKGRSRFKGAGGDKTPPSPISPISASYEESRDLPRELDESSLEDRHSSASPLASATPSLKDPMPQKSNSTDEAPSVQARTLLPKAPSPLTQDSSLQQKLELTQPNENDSLNDHADSEEVDQSSLSAGQGVPQLPALRFSNTDTFGRISAFEPSVNHEINNAEEQCNRRDVAAEMLNGYFGGKTFDTHPTEKRLSLEREIDIEQREESSVGSMHRDTNSPVSRASPSKTRTTERPPKLSIVTNNEASSLSLSKPSEDINNLEVPIGSAEPKSTIQPAVAPGEDITGSVDETLPNYEGNKEDFPIEEKPPRYSFEQESPVLSTPPIIKSPTQAPAPLAEPTSHHDDQVSPDLEPSSPKRLPSTQGQTQSRRQRSPSPEVSPERREVKAVDNDPSGDHTLTSPLQAGIRRQSDVKNRNSIEQRPFSFIPHSPGPEALPRQDIITRDHHRRVTQNRAPSPIQERLSIHSRDRASISQPPSIQEPKSSGRRSKDMTGQLSPDNSQFPSSQRSSTQGQGLSLPVNSTAPYGPPSPALRSKYYRAHSPSKSEEEQYFHHPQSPDGPPINQHPAFKQATPSLPAGNTPNESHTPKVSKVETFLPQPQPTEYQLPAAGSPIKEISSPKPKRASGKFKGFGTASTDPSKPLTPIETAATERLPAQWTTIAERTAQHNELVSPTNAADPNRKRPKRSSLFGNLTKPLSTSQDSTATQASNLRANLLQRSLQSTPQPTEPVPPPKQQALPLTALPGLRGNKSDKKAKGKIQRSSTSADSDSHEGKKKRFSGFGSLFGRSHATTGHSRNEHKPTPPPKKSHSPLSLSRIPFPLTQQLQPDPREQFPYQQAYITTRLPTHREEPAQTQPPSGYYAPSNQVPQYNHSQIPTAYRQYSSESDATRDRSAYSAHVEYMRGIPQERFPGSQRQHPPSHFPDSATNAYGPNPSHPRSAPSNARPIPHLTPDVSGESQYIPLDTSNSSPAAPVSPVLSMRSTGQHTQSPHHYQQQHYFQPPQYAQQIQTRPAQYAPPSLHHSSSHTSSHHSQPPSRSPDVYSAPPLRAHEYPYPRPPPSSVPTISNPPPPPGTMEGEWGNISPARDRMHEQQTPWTLSIPGVDGMAVTPHQSLVPPKKRVDGRSLGPTPPPKIPIASSLNHESRNVVRSGAKDDMATPTAPVMERDVLKGEGVRRGAGGRDPKDTEKEVDRSEESNDDDSEIVMSSTAYPGQEWMPWVGDVD